MNIGYKGYDKTGKLVRGTIEAEDLQQARERVRRQGVFVSEVFAANATADNLENVGEARAGSAWSRTARMESVAALSRQLSLLVSTGTPVVDALESLERQTPTGPFRTVLNTVRVKVEEGKTFAESLQAHPEYFDAVCRSLVAAGESGGKLDVMLNRLSMMMRQEIKIRKSLAGAMVYPCLLMGVAGSVIVVMITFVLPRFKGLFETLDTALPPLTKVLMEISDWLRSWWWVALLLVAGLISGAVFWAKSNAGRLFLDGLVLKLPVIGKVVKAFSTARLARLLSVLLEGRVPVLESLSLARHALRNSRYVTLIASAEEAVLRGESLSASFGETDLISPSVLEAVRSGERSGQLPIILGSVAEHMDEDNDVAIRTLTGLIEPVILIIMGVVVGSVAVGMMLPLFDLTAAGGGT